MKALLLLFTLLLGAPTALAATYTIPSGPLPPGCSVAAGQVNCGSLTLNFADVINVSSATTLNFSGNFNLSANNILINNGGDPANLTLNVAGTLTAGYQARITAANTNVNGNVALEQNSIITGNLRSISGTVTGVNTVQVTGSVTASGRVSLGQSAVVGGNLASLNNNVQMTSGTVGGYIEALNGSITTTLGPSSIGGSVTASTAISLGNKTTVAGSLTSSTSTITLGEEANITGSISAFGLATIGQKSTVHGSVTSSNGGVTTHFQVRIYGSVTAPGNISLGQAGNIGGNVQSSSGSVTTNQSVNINGFVSASGPVVLGQATIVGQSVISGGDVTLNYGVTTGSIDAGGNIEIAQNGVVNGDVDGDGQVDLGYGVHINGNIKAIGDVNISQAVVVDGSINTPGNVNAHPYSNITGYVNSANPDDLGDNVAGPTCNQNANEGPCDGAAGSVLNYRISHAGNMLTCEPYNIEVRACAVAGCPSTTAITGTFTLTATGPETRHFNGVFTAQGTTTVAISLPTAGSYTLHLSSTTPGATQALECQSPSGCTLSAVESGFLWQQADLTPLPAQVAGEPFQAQLVPMNCAAAIPAGNLSVEITRVCDNPGPGACVVGDNLFVAGSSTNTGNVALPYNGSTITVNDLRYDDAGAIRLRAVALLPNGAQLSGNSNVFVVKPHSIGIEVVAPAGSSYPSDVFAKAGEPFAVQLTARNAFGVPTPSFGKEAVPESLTLSGSATVVAPAGGSGQLQIAPNSFLPVAGNDAVFRNPQVSYNEVGSARFTGHINDGDYLGAGDVSTLSAVVSRFIPWAFKLDSSVTSQACMADFTYMGQPLQLYTSLSARNAAGHITANYPDGLAPLASVELVVGDVGQNLALDDSRLAASGMNTDWSAGELILSSTVTVAKLTAPDGPFMQLQLGVKVLDNEAAGPLSVLLPTSPAAIPNCGSDCEAAGGTGKLLYGRLFLADTYGPESESAPVNLEVQNWDAPSNTFVRVMDDNCTSVSPTHLVALEPSGTSAPAGTPGTMESGRNASNTLQWTAPNIAPFSFSFHYDGPSWLRFNSNDPGYDAQGRPLARASFGRYRGHDRILLWQQVPVPVPVP